MKRKITVLATALILNCSLPTFAAEITYFYDGDTVKINDNGQEFKLRINDIDAPEKNQSYGKNRAARSCNCANMASFKYK